MPACKLVVFLRENTLATAKTRPSHTAEPNSRDKANNTNFDLNDESHCQGLTSLVIALLSDTVNKWSK